VKNGNVRVKKNGALHHTAKNEENRRPPSTPHPGCATTRPRTSVKTPPRPRKRKYNLSGLPSVAPPVPPAFDDAALGRKPPTRRCRARSRGPGVFGEKSIPTRVRRISPPQRWGRPLEARRKKLSGGGRLLAGCTRCPFPDDPMGKLPNGCSIVLSSSSFLQTHCPTAIFFSLLGVWPPEQTTTPVSGRQERPLPTDGTMSMGVTRTTRSLSQPKYSDPKTPKLGLPPNWRFRGKLRTPKKASCPWLPHSSQWAIPPHGNGQPGRVGFGRGPPPLAPYGRRAVSRPIFEQLPLDPAVFPPWPQPVRPRPGKAPALQETQALARLRSRPSDKKKNRPPTRPKKPMPFVGSSPLSPRPCCSGGPRKNKRCRSNS